MQTGVSVPYKFQWDVTLVVIASAFILMRLAKILLILITPPGNIYHEATFWVAYPILAVIFGAAGQSLHYQKWMVLILGVIAFGAGLYYWSGPGTLTYVLFYLPCILIGTLIPTLIRRLPQKKE